MSDIQNLALYNQMFEYLSAPRMPGAAHNVLVFGRNDERLAETMYRLDEAALAEDFVVSGAWGKDSGNLWTQGIAESDFVIGIAANSPYNIPRERMHADRKPLDGFDNARFGLDVMDCKGLEHSKITVCSHATSLARLAAVAEVEGARRTVKTHTVYRVGTAYPFNAENPDDQREAAAEIVRLARWPALGLIAVQADLDPGLVGFASSMVPITPMPPSPFKKTILRHMPRDLRRRAMGIPASE